MPDNNLAVYGKWALRRVRVVIEPGANNVYMGSQAQTFRVDYDETIAGGLMETAQRAGYILDGWYTDPDFTNRFLFSTPINDDIEDVEWDYQEDRWRAARIAYGDDSENYQNVRGILHLYAKWIPDTSSRGINVIYDPGDAVLYDSLGNLLTSVPVDPAMHAYENKPSAREAPTNYSDLYSFSYWKAIKENGEEIFIHPGEQIPLDELQAYEIVKDDNGDELHHSVVLTAVYTLIGDPNRKTTITYDGNRFTENMYIGGVKTMEGITRDGTQRVSVTLDKEVNQTIELPTDDDFYLNGYELVGWSFTEGTYAEQVSGAGDNHPNFTPGQQVAADNLVVDAINNRENTLYAMWQPKKYTVTVKQVIESGVPVNNFDYVYRTGVENVIETISDSHRALTGNSSFSVENLEYYNRVGHVIGIDTPTIPVDATYDVRVNAVVTRDDGTVETLNPTSLGNYPILGDVVITYTYSPKVEVKLRKRDAINHNTVVTGAEFTLTPVEFNSATNHWENAGSDKTVTISQATEVQWLQEGTYRLTESTAPENYAKIGTDLYLTIYKDAAFTLFSASGAAISAAVAELDGTGKILTMYDKPIRTVTLSKTLVDDFTDRSAQFGFVITVYDEDGHTVRNYDLGGGTTDNNGQLRPSLGADENIQLKVPHGYKLTVEETPNAMYVTKYAWNGTETAGNTFGSTDAPVEITANGTLVFTNTIIPPSPTGLTFPPAPYALMLAVGVLLLLLRRRRRA